VLSLHIEDPAMRTNIDIDDKLMKQTMKATGAKTKRGAVEAAMRQAVLIYRQGALQKLRGKVAWRGHNDDWFAPAEEILAKRRAEIPDARRDAHEKGSKPPVRTSEPARAESVR
jgi:Arc/MetJ family transcription regulator